jgi:hypothetical protein
MEGGEDDAREAMTIHPLWEEYAMNSMTYE